MVALTHNKAMNGILGNTASNELNPSEVANLISVKDSLLSVLAKLQPREREVLEYRFGISSGCCMSLKEVGKVYKLSAERIRSLEARALRKLRKPSPTRTLQGMLTM